MKVLCLDASNSAGRLMPNGIYVVLGEDPALYLLNDLGWYSKARFKVMEEVGEKPQAQVSREDTQRSEDK